MATAIEKGKPEKSKKLLQFKRKVINSIENFFDLIQADYLGLSLIRFLFVLLNSNNLFLLDENEVYLILDILFLSYSFSKTTEQRRVSEALLKQLFCKRLQTLSQSIDSNEAKITHIIFSQFVNRFLITNSNKFESLLNYNQCELECIVFIKKSCNVDKSLEPFAETKETKLSLVLLKELIFHYSEIVIKNQLIKNEFKRQALPFVENSIINKNLKISSISKSLWLKCASNFFWDFPNEFFSFSEKLLKTSYLSLPLTKPLVWFRLFLFTFSENFDNLSEQVFLDERMLFKDNWLCKFLLKAFYLAELSETEIGLEYILLFFKGIETIMSLDNIIEKEKHFVQFIFIMKRFEERKHVIEKATALFNSNYKKALTFLDQNGLIDFSEHEKSTSRTAARFVLNTPNLNQSQVGELFGSTSPFSSFCLNFYIGNLNLEGRPLLPAFREFLLGLTLPVEGQKIDRILERFANSYYSVNKNGNFKNPDEIHVLIFSLLMLNTDLQNPSVKVKMNENQFVKNTLGSAANIPEDFIRELYKELHKNPITFEQKRGKANKIVKALQEKEDLSAVSLAEVDKKEGLRFLVQVVWRLFFARLVLLPGKVAEDKKRIELLLDILVLFSKLCLLLNLPVEFESSFAALAKLAEEDSMLGEAGAQALMGFISVNGKNMEEGWKQFHRVMGIRFGELEGEEREEAIRIYKLFLQMPTTAQQNCFNDLLFVAKKEENGAGIFLLEVAVFLIRLLEKKENFLEKINTFLMEKLDKVSKDFAYKVKKVVSALNI